MRNLLLTTSFAIALSAPAFAAGTHDGGHGETKPAAMMVGMPALASIFLMVPLVYSTSA